MLSLLAKGICIFTMFILLVKILSCKLFITDTYRDEFIWKSKNLSLSFREPVDLSVREYSTKVFNAYAVAL